MNALSTKWARTETVRMMRARSLVAVALVAAGVLGTLREARAFSATCEAIGVRAKTCRPKLWPNGIVYYEFSDVDGSWSNPLKKTVLDAMNKWTDMTGWFVQFVESKTQPNRAVFRGAFKRDKVTGGLTQDPVQCKSGFGMAATATPQDVFLRGCGQSNVEHELGHLLGFHHTHKRPDRDRYLKVNESMACKPPNPPVAHCGAAVRGDKTNDGFCGYGSYEAYRSQVARDNVEMCTDTDYGVYDFKSVMAYDSSYYPGCGTDKEVVAGTAAFACVHLRRSNDSKNTYNTTVSSGDASALMEMYAEDNGWTRFKPVYRVDPGPNLPLDLHLVSGVSMAGSPALALEGGTKVTAIARGANDRYYLKAQKSDGTWPLGSFQELPGSWSGGPAVVSWSAGNLDVVGLGSDGRVWHAAKRNSAAWGVTGSLGRPETSITSPTVASWGVDHLAVFVVGKSKTLYVKTWNGKAWGSWTPIAVGFKQRPAAVAWGKGRIDVFAVGDAANDVQTVVYDEAACARGAGCKDGWLNPLPFGGVAPSSIGGAVRAGTSPAVASAGVDHLNVYVVGSNGRLWLKSWDGSGWSNWDDLGGMPEASPAAVTTASNTAHVMVNIGGGPFHRQW